MVGLSHPIPNPGADLATLNGQLEGLPPRSVLAWAWEAFGNAIVATSSFQTQSLPLLHMISEVAPGIEVIFLDTGFHFPETLAFRDRVAEELGLLVRTVTPRGGHDAFRKRHGDLHARDPELCCYLNKVEPLDDALAPYRGWIAGVRRDQTAARASFQPVAWDAGGRLKVSPLLTWTQADVWQYLHDHGLPEHPLLAQGYLSIGCAPCTRPVHSGEGSRDGRWSGTAKTECGLHLDTNGS